VPTRGRTAAKNIVSRATRKPAAGQAARSLRTRTRLIEVAGRVFAEQGFDAASGQQICRRAGVHTAAIVYHFGGMARLYGAVLEHARARLVSTEALAAAVAAQPDPQRQLEAFLGLIVRALLSPTSRSWVGKLFSRELLSSTPMPARRRDQGLAARAQLLKSIVAALTGRRSDDALVARACISIIAPCPLLLLVNRRKFLRAFPGFSLTPQSAPLLTQHLLQFALAGLAAVAAQAPQTDAPDR